MFSPRKRWLAVERFARDESGQAGLEFVITLPLLIGVAVIAAEYGDGIQQRETLSGAVRDAARLLSRAPATVPEDASNTVPQIYAPFIEQARQMIVDRTGTTPVSFSVQVESVDETGRFRNDFYTVTVTAAIHVDMALLALFDIDETTDAIDASDGLVMHAQEQARYVGAVPPGEPPACSAIAAALDGCNG